MTRHPRAKRLLSTSGKAPENASSRLAMRKMTIISPGLRKGEPPAGALPGGDDVE